MSEKPSATKPISALRRRMLEDMAVRKFGEKSRHDYIRHVETFAKFLGRSPDTATAEDLRRYQVHQTETDVGPPSINSAASALRFFFTITAGRTELAHQLARAHYPRKLPRILAPEEVARLLEAAPGPGLKYKAALSIAYGAGLRGGEVVMLRVGDIDSKRMLIRVEMGKGRKDRHAMLSPQLLELLRAWWRQSRSQGWLFPGQDQLRPLTVRQLNRVCHMAAAAAGLGAWVTPHTLRHAEIITGEHRKHALDFSLRRIIQLSQAAIQRRGTCAASDGSIRASSAQLSTEATAAACGKSASAPSEQAARPGPHARNGAKPTPPPIRDALFSDCDLPP